jgi:hypothetical protein
MCRRNRFLAGGRRGETVPLPLGENLGDAGSCHLGCYGLAAGGDGFWGQGLGTFSSFERKSLGVHALA